MRFEYHPLSLQRLQADGYQTIGIDVPVEQDCFVADPTQAAVWRHIIRREPVVAVPVWAVSADAAPELLLPTMVARGLDLGQRISAQLLERAEEAVCHLCWAPPPANATRLILACYVVVPKV